MDKPIENPICTAESLIKNGDTEKAERFLKKVTAFSDKMEKNIHRFLQT